MTEVEVATAIPVTALGETLVSNLSATATLVPYLGALTPQHLDAPEAESTALFRGAAVHDLGWLRRTAVRGEDRERWLSGMVTNAVEGLPDKSGAYNLVLNAQGRIQGDLYTWRNGDALELEMTAEQSDALLGHFDRFIIMDDVELVALSGESALGITGPLADQILAAVGLTPLAEGLTSGGGVVSGIPVRLFRGYGTVVPHYSLWVATEQIPELWQALIAAGATAVGAIALEMLRVVEGIPAYGVDIQSRDLAQETSQTRALSFTKGCYLGQEIVERIRSRGQVHRHLRALEFDGDELPVVGMELRSEGSGADAKAAATVTSVTSLTGLQPDGVRRIFGIGMVRAEAEIGNRALVWAGGTARILNAAPKI
jgi:folate-binding protein YgfZ